MIDELLCGVPTVNGIFDTHAHYDDDRFKECVDTLLPTLQRGGVSKIITCGCDIASSKAAVALAEKFDFVYAAVGFHPENLPKTEPNFDLLLPLCENRRVVAIGEIGLDHHYDIDPELQLKWFEAQLRLANRLNMPVIVHDREAHGETAELLKKYKPRGVVHAFSGSVEFAEELLKIGIYIGIGGVLTFKNAKKLLQVAKELPSDRILLETDCPYMAPTPFRGKTCHSGHIALTARKLAELRGERTADVLNYTHQNACTLFGIK